MKFYISSEGRQLGPWSTDEILKKIEDDSLNWTDYLFDDSTKEWVLLMEHPDFAKSFRTWVQPKTKPESSSFLVSEVKVKDDKQWFVLKENNKYGPFTYLELVKLLQEKNLYEYDFVWNSTLPQWKRVAEVESFQPDKIRSLRISENKEIQKVFFRRRYARASYGASLVIHNSKAVWKGKSLEISSGGAGIVVDTNEFEPGQTLFLHFKVADGVPPFNAICSVVSKNFVGGPGQGLVKYGVKFTNISQSIQQAIKNYTDKVA